MSKRAWIIFSVICVALLGGLVYISAKDRVDVSDVDTKKILGAESRSGNIADHVFGKADSKVIFMEYGDFQCPGCGSAHPTIKKVTEKYKDYVAFVFRNFPITTKHPNARAAAATAEAAGLQGKYWEMHNKVYESQSAWGNLESSKRVDFFAGYATELGLNVDTFKKDLESAEVSKKINFDLATGKKIGVEATPSFYLNGTAVSEKVWQDETKLDEAIVAELKKNGVVLPEVTQ